LRNIRSLSLRSLTAAFLWSHRVALAAWSVGVGAVMVIFAYSFRGMVDSFQGGAAGFAAAAQVTADAMRPLSGPAVGLDAYAGYVTYHNVGIWSLLLAVYASIQGALALRGLEERGVLQLYVASSSRLRVMSARVVAFGAAMVMIAAGTGIGMGVGLFAAGTPDWASAFGLAGLITLTASVFYSLALVVSQATRSASAAAGTASGLAVASYLFSNMYEQFGPLGVLRFVSPFFYLLQSRFVMVAGHHADPAATVVLAVAFVALCLLAWPLFARRDVDAAALRIPFASRHRDWTLRQRRASLRSLWTFFVRAQWTGLLGWIGGVFVLEFAYLRIFPQVREIWESSDIVKALISAAAGNTLIAGYVSLAIGFVAIVAAAFAVVQSGRWLVDRASGRDEMYVAALPVSRLRLSLERWLALAVGLTAISLGGVAGLIAGAAASGMSLDAGGVVRTGADVVLVGLAVGGLSSALATWLRSSLALGVLATVLALSYLLTVLRPLFSGRTGPPTSRCSTHSAIHTPACPRRLGSRFLWALPWSVRRSPGP
jgi:ABC-2 type transport system permease protein